MGRRNAEIVMKKITAEFTIKEYSNGDKKVYFKGTPNDVGKAIADYLVNIDDSSIAQAYCIAILTAVDYYRKVKDNTIMYEIE